RTRTVAVAMSGGLDSSTVAAAVKRVLTSDGEPFDLRAHTVVFDRIIPDEERKYAGLVAAALDIPIEFLVADDYRPYDSASPRASVRFAEPADVRNRALGRAFWTGMAARSRIVFSGDDADSLLNE